MNSRLVLHKVQKGHVLLLEALNNTLQLYSVITVSNFRGVVLDTVEHEIHACPKYSELGSFAL